MSKRIVPTQDYILMEVVKAATSIALPETVELHKDYVAVVDVGPDVKNIRMGDKVLTAPGELIRVHLSDEQFGVETKKEYYMAKEEMIIGVIKDFSADLN